MHVIYFLCGLRFRSHDTMGCEPGDEVDTFSQGGYGDRGLREAIQAKQGDGDIQEGTHA